MKTKTKLFTALLLISTSAAAVDYTDTARVVDAQPIIEQQARQECHTETVQVQQQAQGAAQGGPDYTGAAIGGVAGGVIGNQVGGGNGKTVATALGAVVGALTGFNMQNQQNANAGAQAPQQARQVCTNNAVPVTTGYRVRYSYLGKEGSTVTRSQPGQTIQVGVTAFQ